MDFVGNDVKKLNDGIPTHAAGVNDFMTPVKVADGTYVLAVGYAHDGTTGKLTIAQNQKIGHPDLIGRIVLGVGPNSDLVKEGLIQKSGMCPNGMKRADHFLYNNYNVVVPRLAATSTALVQALGGTEKVTLTFTNERTKETKTVEIRADEAEPLWSVTTFCPEGDVPGGTGEPVWVLTNVTAQ
ncbi:hypothetical protein [Brockia lithotrophica]|nr:hypothetical protein [Brockia lithotrophica]